MKKTPNIPHTQKFRRTSPQSQQSNKLHIHTQKKLQFYRLTMGYLKSKLRPQSHLQQHQKKNETGINLMKRHVKNLNYPIRASL